MKKDLLFVIPSLDAGGAEKSLVNLLYTINSDIYNVDLYLFHKKGLFLEQIPSYVNVLENNENFKIFSQDLSSSVIQFVKNFNFKLAFYRLAFFFKNTIDKKPSAEQFSWKYISKSIDKITKNYDASIAFLEKSAIYFVVDKTNAHQKIGYIHNDYNKLQLDADFDRNYFKKLDKIITVSEECKNVLDQVFLHPEKNLVIENISSPLLINELAEEPLDIDLGENSMVSIGRLHHQKGFDLGIEAAKILKNNKVDFKWYIIGEGEERKNLENKINEYQLQENFILLGNKKNPYHYLKKATIYVHPSRFEGKSIAIDEAKILQKPIIVTDFSTAKDQLVDNFTSLFSTFEAYDLAQKIELLLLNKELQKKLTNNLENQFSTEKEIEKFYQLFQ